MKIVFCLLVLMMVNKECAPHKTVDTTESRTNSQIPSNVIQISYEATTRGFYERIWITKDSITVTNDRNQQKKMSRPTPQIDWNELMAILNDVDIKSLPTLEAPTSMRQYDGAAIASLIVTQNKEEIKTNSFDHGHPPKAIEALVNKVLSMNDMSKKQ